MTQTALFKSAALRSAPARGVDGHTIRGAKVIEFGDINDDRPFTVDSTTLSQVVQMINGPNKGLKARWTHPNLCEDGMGKHLGYWQNARIEGQAVTADLTISPTAFNSPMGDIGTYVLELAKDDPDAFGVSVAGQFADDMLKELEQVEKGTRVPIRFAKLRAADVVADPAATRGGLFSIDELGVPAWASSFLDHQFSDLSPQDVLERVTQFLSRHYGVDLMAKDATAKVATPNEVTPQVITTDMLKREDAQPFTEAFGAQGALYFLEGKSLVECFQVEHAKQLEQNAQLNERIKELESLVGQFDQLDGEGEPLSSGERIDLSKADEYKVQREQELRKKGVAPAIARSMAAQEAARLN